MINRRDNRKTTNGDSSLQNSFSMNIDTIYTYQEAYKEIMDDDLSLQSSDHSTTAAITRGDPMIGMVALTYPMDKSECDYHPTTSVAAAGAVVDKEQRLDPPISPYPMPSSSSNHNNTHRYAASVSPSCTYRYDSPVRTKTPRSSAVTISPYSRASLQLSAPYGNSKAQDDSSSDSDRRRARTPSDMSLTSMPQSLRLGRDDQLLHHNGGDSVSSESKRRQSHHHRARNMALTGDDFWSQILKEI